MKINEAAKQAELSQRAVKYYEAQGLLKVRRQDNGYRNYSEQDVERLKKISLYRKLGVSLQDIRTMLDADERKTLRRIAEEKRDQLVQQQRELEALQNYLNDGDLDEVNSFVDYESIGKAMREMLPGPVGEYLARHFQPFLQIRITTPQQKEAYQRILAFWDNPDLKIPWPMRLIGKLRGKTESAAYEAVSFQTEESLQALVHLSEVDYERLKENTLRVLKRRTSFGMRLLSNLSGQRRWKKRLQDCGYNDLFIPAMMELSPSYRKYHEALDAVNHRLCQDLGLYYDSDFDLIRK